MNLYETCPTFETAHFVCRLVTEDDSPALLDCYSDPKAQQNFNTDGCLGDFCMTRLEDMKRCIQAWLFAYDQQEFIRFAIVDRRSARAIGTIEMFGNVGKTKTKTGILRVDVVSDFEKQDLLDEIFDACNAHFFDWFKVDEIATKVKPHARERRKTLLKLGYTEGSVHEREHYFVRLK